MQGRSQKDCLLNTFSGRVTYSHTRAKQKQSRRKRKMGDPRHQSRRIAYDDDSCFTCLDSSESKLEQEIRRIHGNSLQEKVGNTTQTLWLGSGSVTIACYQWHGGVSLFFSTTERMATTSSEKQNKTLYRKVMVQIWSKLDFEQLV